MISQSSPKLATGARLRSAMASVTVHSTIRMPGSSEKPMPSAMMTSAGE